jgi:class 3 adenylate cyclase
MPSLKADSSTDAVVILFTDIESSTRLWEQHPERMSQALAAHDALARSAVEGRGGRIVKTTGDGMHAAFDDALDALAATVDLQRAIAGLDDRRRSAAIRPTQGSGGHRP